MADLQPPGESEPHQPRPSAGPTSAASQPVPAAAEPHPMLSMRGVSKSYGAVAALRDVRLDRFPGEAHGLVGENGAGKSTLVKVLAGVHRPDSGEVLLDGAPLQLSSPADARAAGIAVIYQEPTLFPDLSVAENIFIGRQHRGRAGAIDSRAMEAEAAGLFARLGAPLDPARPARGLSIADQQLVEIAKALSMQARVIVMDEPTAALSGVEVQRLFGVARGLTAAGPQFCSSPTASPRSPTCAAG